MKTSILSLLLMGSSLALCAQETGVPKDSLQNDTTRTAPGITTDQGNTGIDTANQGSDTVSTIRSTGAYGAYGGVNVPTTVQNTFMSQYPNAGSAMWERDTATNMWLAKYNTGGRNMKVYMDERGNSYSIALPIVESMVSEDVISSAVNKFGHNVYDILQLKTGDSTSPFVYQVRLIENGQVRPVYVGEDGNETTYTPVVHTSAADSAAHMDSMNNWNNNQDNQNNTMPADTMNKMDDNTRDTMMNSDTMMNNQQSEPANPDASGVQPDSTNKTDPNQDANNQMPNNEALPGNNNTNPENRPQNKKEGDTGGEQPLNDQQPATDDQQQSTDSTQQNTERSQQSPENNQQQNNNQQNSY